MIKTLLALGAGGVFISAPLGGALSFAAEGDAKQTFAAVSAFVTFQDNLDADVMEAMYKVFGEEPYAPEFATAILDKVKGALERPSLKGGQFTEGEIWFMGHLLKTWYLGIYYHERCAPIRVTYEHALMYDAAGGDIPVPLTSSVAFGSWAKKPT